MATPVKYMVTVNKFFQFQDLVFRPPEMDGPKAGFPCYQVPAAIYNGTIDDGTAFSTLCATADPIYDDSGS